MLLLLLNDKTEHTFRPCKQKALNLKPGANSITFSLSASGVIACTARIFVWDSTDLVVVSDIDGTITKWVFCGQSVLAPARICVILTSLYFRQI
jgi:phosphatidate phosphatase PAH1